MQHSGFCSNIMQLPPTYLGRYRLMEPPSYMPRYYILNGLEYPYEMYRLAYVS